MNADEQAAKAVAPPGWRRWVAVAAGAGLGLWWLGSLLLHGLVFGALLLAGRLKTPAADADDFHMTISPEHIRSVVEDIRAQQKEQFAQRVQEMAAIKAQLDALNTRKVEQFNALVRADAHDAQDARQEVQKAADAVRADQEAALAAQRSAAAAATLQGAEDKLAETPDDGVRAVAQRAADEARQAVESNQAATGQAQRRAADQQARLAEQAARLGTTAAKDARQAEEAAQTAQQQAEKQQQEAAGNRDAVAQDGRNVEQQSAAAGRDHAAADAAQQQVAAAESRLAQPPPAAPAAAPVSPAAPAPPPPPAAQDAAQLTAQLTQAREQKQKADEQAANSARALASARAAAADHLRKLQDDQSRAQQQQQAALAAQASADARIAAALAAPTPPSLPAAVATNAPPPTAPADADLAQLFQQAQQMEAAVAQSYRNVRAAELAAIRRIPVEQAAALTEVAKPTRDAIDTAILTRDIHDVQSVREQEHTLAAASAQVDSMVALAQRMEALAQPAQDASLTVATLRTRAAQTARMEQLAMEDEGTKAKDLTATMKAADDAAGRGGADDPAVSARAGTALGTAAARLALNPLDVAALLELQLALAAQATGAGGAGGEQALAGAANGQRVDEPGVGGTAPPEPPTIDAQHFKPIPGRTVSASMVATPPGRQAEWMFVDSWYLIGPWPNPGRKNLDTKFPPESVVDLDATYTGGRQNEAPLPVRWQFYQASAARKIPQSTAEYTGMIVPPGLDEFEIYYAYTELWFDEAGDYWVAIGSDDQSKIWLNDQMVWKSADYYKGWTANEGLRRLHFHRGVNRLLYRLENGHMSGGYSFMICLNGTSAQPAPEARPARGR